MVNVCKFLGVEINDKNDDNEQSLNLEKCKSAFMD